MNHINNIIEFAARLVIEGNATPDNAIFKALKNDSEMCLNCIDDLNDMNRGYNNQNVKTQKAFNILLESVYSKLQKPQTTI